MGSNLLIISILLSVTKFDVIRAIGGVAIPDCENYQFFGNCIKEELCLCHESQWYRTSFADIRSLISEYQSFSDICACSSLEPGRCINQNAYSLVIAELKPKSLIYQTTETECSQMLTVSQSTTISTATTGGQDMTSTAYTTSSTTEQTTRTEASVTGAMCPCQCEYFDKIEYWAQEVNQRKQYEELSQKLAEIKGILKMETKNLSSFVNKKISAADDRPSVVATGYLGAGIMTIVLAGIVLLDLPVIIRQARLLFRDIQRLCARA